MKKNTMLVPTKIAIRLARVDSLSLYSHLLTRPSDNNVNVNIQRNSREVKGNSERAQGDGVMGYNWQVLIVINGNAKVVAVMHFEVKCHGYQGC